MSEGERDAFLAARRYGILTTLQADGSPVAVPVWFERDGAAVRMFTHRTSPKVRRLRRDARASLLVVNSPEEPEQWVAFDGTVAIAPGGLAVAERLTPKYWPAGDPRAPTLDEWRRNPDDWLMLVLTPKAIRSNRG